MSIRRKPVELHPPVPRLGSLYGGAIGLKAGVVPHIPPPPAPKSTRAAFIPQYRTVPLEAGEGPRIVDPPGDGPGLEPYFEITVTYQQLALDKTSVVLFAGIPDVGTHVLGIKVEDVLSRADRKDIAEAIAGSLLSAMDTALSDKGGKLFNTSMVMTKNAYQCGAPMESWWYVAYPTAYGADAAAVGDFNLEWIFPYVFAYTNENKDPVGEGVAFELDGATFKYKITPVGDGSGITMRCVKQP